MNTDQRRRAVERALAEDPQPSQRTIASRLKVSQATIRRDIARLRPVSPVTQADSPSTPQVRSAAAQALIAALDAELADNAKAAGEPLEWSAAERAVLELIANHVDRRGQLQAAYDAVKPDQVRTRIALATEIRLTEAGIGRLVRQVRTEPPPTLSITSLKARRAVRVAGIASVLLGAVRDVPQAARRRITNSQRTAQHSGPEGFVRTDPACHLPRGRRQPVARLVIAAVDRGSRRASRD